MHIKEFKPWLEKETSKVLQPLNEEARELVDKIGEKLDSAREACEKLREEGTKEIEKGKAIRKAKATEKLSRHFLRQINKIAFPDKMSYSELKELHKNLKNTLSSIGMERSLWFPRISPLFIIARKRVDFAFSRLAGSISDFGAFLSDDYSKAKVVEELFLETEEMKRLLDNLSKHERRRDNIKRKMQSVQTKIEKSEKNIKSIRNSTKLSDITEIRKATQKLKKQVKHEFRHLRKPFMKFANLTRGPQYSLSSEEAKKLSQYLKDPFTGFASEKPGYPTLKSILRKMERLMEEGKLKLKSSRLRKGREKIDAILKENQLDNLYQSCASVYSQRRQLTSSKETQAAQRKFKHLKRRLQELQKRGKAVKVRLGKLEEKQNQLVEKVNKQKRTLEKLVYRILKSHVELKL